MAQSINFHETTLTSICTCSRNVGMALLEAIAANMPNINMNWIFTGEGDMEISQKDETNDNIAAESEAKYYITGEKIKFYEDEIARKNEVIDALREANNAYKVAMEIIKGGKQ